LNKFYRINQYIKSTEVRVIDASGKQIGVLPTRDALKLAQEDGLDLVEVASVAKPPVAKIIDFKKFQYIGQSRSTQDTKEVRFTPFMASNDLNTKLSRAREFLLAGDRVRLVVKFTGREMGKRDFGEKILESAHQSLSDIAKIAENPKMLGRQLISQLIPKKNGKSK